MTVFIGKEIDRMTYLWTERYMNIFLYLILVYLSLGILLLSAIYVILRYILWTA